MHLFPRWCLLSICIFTIILQASGHRLWMDSENGIDTGNGNQTNPLKTFEGLHQYLSSHGLMNCWLELLLAEGVYHDPNLPSTIAGLSIEPDTTRENTIEIIPKISIYVSASSEIFSAADDKVQSIIIKGVSFHPSSMPDSTKNANSLLTLSSSFLKLENVEFIGFRRNSSLISSYLGSTIEARGITAIDNECFRVGFRSTRGAVFGGLSGSLTIIDSIFELNRVVYMPPILNLLDLTAAGAVYSYGPLVLNRTVFRSNSVQLITESTHQMSGLWACGGALMSRGHSTFIDECYFDSNFVAANDFHNQQTIGGAICVSTDGIVNITNSSFTANHAGNGGAISDLPPELLVGPSSASISILSSTFVQNRCLFLGCAISLSPTTKFHLFLFKSTFDNNIIMRQKRNEELISADWTSFEVIQKELEDTLRNLSHSAPLHLFERTGTPKPPPYCEDLIGGAGLAVVVQRSSLGGFGVAKVTLSDVVFTNQSEPDPMCDSRGLALVLHKLDVVTIERVQFLNHSSSSSRSIVDIREAKSMYLDSLTLRNNKNYGSLADKVQVILDITGSITSWPSHSPNCDPDYRKIKNDQESAQQSTSLFAWTITNLVLENNIVRNSVVSITNTPSILFEDSKWSGNVAPLSEPASNQITTLISFTGSSSCVIFRNIIVSQTSLPISMSYLAGTTFISSCLFEQFQDTNSNSLRVRDMTFLIIKNSTFQDNAGTSISSTASLVQLRGSKFLGNWSPAGPGVAEVTSGYLGADDSQFLRNTGIDGGAISSTGTLHLVRSQFLHNEAHNGGAIHTIASKKIYLTDVTCKHNRAINNGGCLFYGAKELTSPRPEHDHLKTVEIDDEVPFLAVENSLISRNEAQTGGALSLSGCIDSTVEGTIFSSNFASVSGGAVEIHEGPFGNTNGRPVLRSRSTSCAHHFENCTYFNNTACSRSPYSTPIKDRPTHLNLIPRCSGGALNVQSTQIDIINCTLLDNQAMSFGGAIYALNTLRALTRIVDSKFIRNHGRNSGGALVVVENDALLLHANQSCEMLVTNNTFASNSARFGGAFTWAPGHSCKIGDYKLANIVMKYNEASTSGGAVYVDLPSPSALYHYQNISFTRNSAFISGGTFFLNARASKWKSNYTPPTFCDSLLRCSVVPITARTASLQQAGFQYPYISWGPIQASGRWHAKFDLNSIALRTFTVGSLTIGATFFDLYGQQVVEDILADSRVAPSLDPHLASLGSLEALNWTDSALTITASVHKALARYPPAAWAPDEVTRFLFPVTLQGLVSLLPTLYGGTADAFEVESISNVVVNVTVFRCARGQGLWPSPTNPELFACVPCPLGTYNIVEDGQCYSCQGKSGGSYEVSCQQDNVTSSAGFWTSDLAKTLKTNELFITKCDPIHCAQGGCVKGRTGILCGSCEEGQWETLFAYCGQICARPNIFFLVTLAISLLIMTCAFHYFLQSHPLPTMHVCAVGSMGMIILGPALDWSIPTFLPTIASFFCGFRANSIQRALFLSGFPYASLVVLLLLSILKLVKLGRFFTTFSSGLLKSAFGILLILAIPSMKHAVGWAQCTTTPVGLRWSLGPEFICDQPVGTVSLAILTSISVIPILLACTIIASSFSKQPIDLLDFSTILINRDARKTSRVTSIVDLLARLGIAIVFSATYYHLNTRTVVLGGILLVLFVGNTLAPIFTSSLQRAALSISYGTLVVLAITEPVLYLSKSYPVIAFGIFSVWCAALIVTLGFGHRAPSLILEYNWEIGDDGQQ